MNLIKRWLGWRDDADPGESSLRFLATCAEDREKRDRTAAAYFTSQGFRGMLEREVQREIVAKGNDTVTVATPITPRPQDMPSLEATFNALKACHPRLDHFSIIGDEKAGGPAVAVTTRPRAR